MKARIIIVALAAATFAGCANNSPVGVVDVGRVVANWDVYQRYQQQLVLEEQAIASSKASNAQKNAQALALQKKYSGITTQLTNEIRDAAGKIAQQRNLKLIVTNEGVGYGGVDITTDVEKAMNIVDKPVASPSI